MTRALRDENLPRKLKWSLTADAVTVPEHGWAGVKNGQLLKLAAQEFGAFDQQKLSGRSSGKADSRGRITWRYTYRDMESNMMKEKKGVALGLCAYSGVPGHPFRSKRATCSG